jgi:16S rRNA (cytidine1402-2'-O)-methyltransferase
MPKLFLIPTPLNQEYNLISESSKEILTIADFVIGEEKKVVLRLLAANKLRGKQYYLLNEHTKYEEKFSLAQKVKSANIVVLFSDAGTPCISDPGYDFVDICHLLQIEVKSLNLESSILAALSASGFYAEKFIYLGFPPIKGEKRKNFFKSLPVNNFTSIFLERPYVIKKIVDELSVVKSRIFISINIGFEDEKYLRGYIKDIAKEKEQLKKSPFVVVVEGANSE